MTLRIRHDLDLLLLQPTSTFFGSNGKDIVKVTKLSLVLVIYISLLQKTDR